MSEKLLKILPFALGILVIGNLLVLDFFWITSKKPEKPAPVSQPPVEPEKKPTPGVGLTGAVSEISCPEDCASLIEEKVSEAVAEITPATTQEAVTTQAPAQETQTAKVLYLPLGGANSTSAMDWTDIAGDDFYFDLSDYPGAKSVRWEVSLQSYLSSNQAYIRLYDVTNKRAVDGSDLSTNSSAYEYLRSSDLTIWRGNNLYRIQAKGASGNTVNFNSPRLKIILK